ncbi:MAG: ATP-binding cassette domain-containing protein [Polyangiaceae bacterium]|nr:ATP-binding cassette domain-containing protein [Polyangiaceae bacterium]
MSLLGRLGRQTISIGRDQACDIIVPGDRTHEDPQIVDGDIIHEGGGSLILLPLGEGRIFLDGRALAAQEPLQFDFRPGITIRGHRLNVAHPAISSMLMSRGHLPFDGRELLLGRDPERVHLVLASPGVSGLHLKVIIADNEVEDQNSTSGTFIQEERIEPKRKVKVASEGVLWVGPLPVAFNFLLQLHQELGTLQHEATRTRTQTIAVRTQAAQKLRTRQGAKHPTVLGTVQMEGAKQYSLGRSPECDLVLDYPQLSAFHARVSILDGRFLLEDLDSELGVFVRGSRLKPQGKAEISENECFRLGALSARLRRSEKHLDVIVDSNEDWSAKALYEVEAAQLGYAVRDRADPSRQVTLLKHVNFRALPGDFIALMGPSGSGKTTLLNLLTGRSTATAGAVRINGEDISVVAHALRGAVGYVPQDDLVHPELTVREAISYSARLRLPADFSPEEVNGRIDQTLEALGLVALQHLQIGKPEAKVLSGGQRKRVNIALELVTDPAMLFLDEPTSGLAADDTTALIELLAQLARGSGKTIIATVHQPAKDEFERFNLALILGRGGLPLYFGPTQQAYSFFEGWRPQEEQIGIDNPRDIFAELAERRARAFARLRGSTSEDRQRSEKGVAEKYHREYQSSEIAQEMKASGRSPEAPSSSPPTIQKRPSARLQLGLLIERYAKIKKRDRWVTGILLAQAPLIGLLLALVFGPQKQSIPAFCVAALSELSQRTGGNLGQFSLTSFKAGADHAPALFFLIISAVWFGTSNAAREIVKERAILEREAHMSLGIRQYVFSKFIVLAGLCLIQCCTLLAIVFPCLAIEGGWPSFLQLTGICTLTAWTSVASGLVLSSLVSSDQAATALTPLTLIPQVILGGLIVPLSTNHALKWPMMLMPTRWGFEASLRSLRNFEGTDAAWHIPVKGSADSPPDFIINQVFDCARAQVESQSLPGSLGFGSSMPSWGPPLLLTLMTILLISVSMAIVQRRTRSFDRKLN